MAFSLSSIGNFLGNLNPSNFLSNASNAIPAITNKRREDFLATRPAGPQSNLSGGRWGTGTISAQGTPLGQAPSSNLNQTPLSGPLGLPSNLGTFQTPQNTGGQSPYTPSTSTPPTGGGTPGGAVFDSSKIPFQQAADAANLIAQAQQRASQQATLSNSLNTAQQQLAEAQSKYNTIISAQTAGFGGNNYAQAVSFLTGEDDQDSNFAASEQGGDTLENLEQQVNAALQALTGSIAPSSNELAAENQLQNILTSRDLGIEAVRTKPIATPFIRGQSAAIQRQAELQTRPLLQQVANIQRQRDIQRQIAQVQYQAASDALSRGERREREKKEDAQTLRSQINEIVLKAAQSGASGEAIQAIRNARTVGDAIQAASPYLQQQENDFSGTSSDFQTLATILGRQPSQQEFLNFIQQKGAAGRQPEGSGNTLTQSEASSLGLPNSLIGKSEGQVMNDLNQPNAPQWFDEFINLMETSGRQISPQERDARWEEFRRGILTGSGGGSGRQI